MNTEIKTLSAVARAHEVFDALDRISSLEEFVIQVLKNHNEQLGINSTRRDCKAFWKRLEELNLTERAKACGRRHAS